MLISFVVRVQKFSPVFLRPFFGTSNSSFSLVCCFYWITSMSMLYFSLCVESKTKYHSVLGTWISVVYLAVLAIVCSLLAFHRSTKLLYAEILQLIFYTIWMDTTPEAYDKTGTAYPIYSISSVYWQFFETWTANCCAISPTVPTTLIDLKT